MDPNIKRAENIIARVAEHLSERLATLEGTPVDLDAAILKLLPEERKFAAFVTLDRDRPGSVVIEISPSVVLETIEALRTAGWNFVEQAVVQCGADAAESAIEPILELTLQWVMLHEMAHWGLGHLGYRASLSGQATARLSCADNSFDRADDAMAANAATAPDVEEELVRDLCSEEYRCMELQADFQATLLLDILHEEEDSETEPMPEGEIHIPASRQSVALAAGVAILMVQRSRGQRAAGQCGLRHPSPEARALSVMSVLLAQSLRHLGREHDDGIRIPMEDDQQVQMMRSVTLDALRMFYRYLAPFAEALNVEPIFSNATLVPARISDASEELVPLTARDLLIFMLDPNASAERFETAGGRELSVLRPFNDVLRHKTAPFAVWHL